jgi:2-polyprenyl-6-methoxyphenol hydroxylase-like FAD-dependent oxidoreductase
MIPVFQNKPVIIVGAGPVGLLLANLLGCRNIPAIVLEKKTERVRSSKAIGVTPPSLTIFEKIALDRELVANGVKVEKAVVHGTSLILGKLRFQKLSPPFPFILAIPQYQTESILEENLKRYSCIQLLKGREFQSLEKKERTFTVRAENLSNGQTESFETEYLCACDGKNSSVRSFLKLPFPGNRYKDTFLMGDFQDKTSLNNEAHLFFTRYGSVESFPLPENQRRWIIQTRHFMDNPPENFLIEQIEKRSGYELKPSDQISQSPFGTQHYRMPVFHENGVFFAGDAAHIMSPIGGQGMNTGLADADLLAFILETRVRENAGLHKLEAKYSFFRRKAAKTATFRAKLSMKTGTLRGAFPSLIRNIILFLLLHAPIKKKIVRYFSMKSIPFSTLAEVLQKDRYFSKKRISMKPKKKRWERRF